MLEKIKRIIPQSVFKFIQPIYHFVLAYLSALVYNFPSNKMIIIGVTGTAGKTSTVYLIARALESAGWLTGYSSTAQISDGKKEWLNNKKMTMPGRFFIQKQLYRMYKNSCRFAVIETTSQGIEQFRHRFINYDTVVVTGLYPEHIEAHGGFENYKKAKGKLCNHLKRCSLKYVNSGKQVVRPNSELQKIDLERIKKTIIVNGDNEHANYFLEFWADSKLAFVSPKNADDINNKVEQFSLKEVKTTENGTSFNIDNVDINLKLWGDFQAENASLAALVAHSYRVDWEKIKLALESVSSLVGKMEQIEGDQDFKIIIDYAYEPVALEKVYGTLKYFKYNKLIQVIGSAGGGRDSARRPQLGLLAGLNVDYVVVSNEDPYDEDPQLIIEQVASGALKAGKILDKDLFKILDRREAIKKALKLAKKDDLVLITGKGAEQGMCLANGQIIPWDDRKVVREELAELLSV
jgi:UDP-N-acetylmuramoyl-L-alanyl-D-glutamate--2,6-diaminopimelate ligase